MATMKVKSKWTRDRLKPKDKHTKASWAKRNKTREGTQKAYVAAKAELEAEFALAMEAASAEAAS